MTAALVLFAKTGRAEEKEAVAELEIGGLGEWDLRGGGLSFGPSAAIEVTPIKDWLEVEFGITPLLGDGRTEWDTGLVFKRPFILSDSIEIMPGLGPEWVHTVSGGKTTDSLGAEAVLDLQFWPSPERKFGWFLEPSYGYDFGRGHEQSLGLTVGLLFPIR